MRVYRFSWLSLLAIVAALLSVDRSAAQQVEPHHAREGFWFSAGLGAGSLEIDCDGCGGDSEVSGAGWMRLGAALNSRVLIGIETAGWLDHHDYGDDTFGALSGVLLLYPSEDAGFFVEGGVGLAQLRFEEYWDELEVTGFSWTAGVGFDLRVGQNLSITPYASALGMLEADAELDGFDTGERFRATLFQFGLGITFH